MSEHPHADPTKPTPEAPRPPQQGQGCRSQAGTRAAGPRPRRRDRQTGAIQPRRQAGISRRRRLVWARRAAPTRRDAPGTASQCKDAGSPARLRAPAFHPTENLTPWRASPTIPSSAWRRETAEGGQGRREGPHQGRGPASRRPRRGQWRDAGAPPPDDDQALIHARRRDLTTTRPWRSTARCFSLVRVFRDLPAGLTRAAKPPVFQDCKSTDCEWESLRRAPGRTLAFLKAMWGRGRQGPRWQGLIKEINRAAGGR